MRSEYSVRARVTIRPTHKGRTELDDWHPYARFRYVSGKPVREFKNDEFLWILKAEKEGYVEVSISTKVTPDEARM